MNAKADQDTICAVATASGRGGIGVVRVSGPQVPTLITDWLCAKVQPRRAIFCQFPDAAGEPIDHGLAIYFPAPHSYSGEDVLEIQAHGNPVVLEYIVSHLVSLGIRRAHPGEFTQRAFINDRMDLAQAEAVADLIAATSLQAARAAHHSLEGTFSSKINVLVEDLTHLRVYVEAALDFPDEEIDFLADGQVLIKLDEILKQIHQLKKKAEQGRILNDGLKVAIVGRPNAGKSSLLNILLGKERAIVTDIPGTTRDILSERIHIQGLPLELLDTAGIRETEDIVEAEGVKRAQQVLQAADLVLWITDCSAADEDPAPAVSVPLIQVFNKIDLAGLTARQLDQQQVWLSAKQGTGIDLLEQAILHQAGLHTNFQSEFSARARHIEIIQLAIEQLEQARYQLVEYAAGELLAEELKLAADTLGEITGKVSSDELLGKIFSAFCIGK